MNTIHKAKAPAAITAMKLTPTFNLLAAPVYFAIDGLVDVPVIAEMSLAAEAPAGPAEYIKLPELGPTEGTTLSFATGMSDSVTTSTA